MLKCWSLFQRCEKYWLDALTSSRGHKWTCHKKRLFYNFSLAFFPNKEPTTGIHYLQRRRWRLWKMYSFFFPKLLSTSASLFAFRLNGKLVVSILCLFWSWRLTFHSALCWRRLVSYYEQRRFTTWFRIGCCYSTYSRNCQNCQNFRISILTRSASLVYKPNPFFFSIHFHFSFLSFFFACV